MPTAATWITALGLFLAGHAVLALAERAGPARPRGALERHGLALLLGLTVVPAALVAWCVASGGPPSPLAGRVLLGLPALVGLPFALVACFARGEVAPPPERAGARALGRIANVGAWVFAGFACFYAASMPMHLFDPLFHFAYKGAVLFHEGFGGPSWMIVPPELADTEGVVGRAMTHPNYPPGVPALHALVACVAGAFDHDATRPLFALYLLGALAVLHGALARRSRAAAAFGVFALASLPLLYYSRLPSEYWDWARGDEAGYVASLAFAPLEVVRAAVQLVTGGGRMPDGWTLDGAADLPLAALLAGAFLCLRRVLPGDGEADRGDVAVGGLLLGGALLAKNEGLMLAGVLGLALALAALAGRLVRPSALSDGERAPLPAGRVALAFALALAVAAPWLAVRGDIPSIDEDYPRALAALVGVGEPAHDPAVSPQAPNDLGEAVARAPVVLGGLLVAFTHVLRWNLLWPLAALALLAWLPRPRALLAHAALPALLLVLGSIAAYALILVVSPWDLTVLYGTAIPDRLLLHVAPLALVAACQLLWPTRAELER